MAPTVVARAIGVAALLLFILPMALAVASKGTSKAASDEFVYLVFTRRCLDLFASGTLSAECLKITISKLLGYAIITGACVVKLPQIIAFLRAGNVRGVNREATYTDLLGYLLQAGYYLMLGKPFSAYGETLIIAVQSIVIVLMIWGYDYPGTVHAGVVAAVLTVAASIPFSLPPQYLPYLQLVCTLLFVISRAAQIMANYSQGGTGQLAFLTLFMNAGGSAARIFTSSVEVKQPEVLLSFAISTLLNLTLVAQYIYYNMVVAKAVAPKAAAAVSADKSTVEPPVSSASTSSAPPSSRKAPASSASKRGSKQGESESVRTVADADADAAPPSSGKASSTRRKKGE